MRRETHPPQPLGGWKLPAILGTLVLLAACAPAPPEEGQEEAGSPAGTAAEDAATPDGAPAAGVTPVPFPDGFDFPTDRSTIEGWVADQDTQAMFGHAWDIWNGMFQPSGESQEQPGGTRELVVFETWASDVDVFDSGATSSAELSAAMPDRSLKPFHVPRQLGHASLVEAAPPDTDPEQVIAFVKYDPVAAGFIVSHGYNQASTLDQLQASWPPDTPALDREIDQFDNPSIALKPTWYLVKETGLTSFPVWPGPPDPAESFPPSAWDTCVLVDPTDQGGGGTQEGDCNGTQEDLPVVNLDRFHFQQLTADEAAHIQSLQGTADSLRGAEEGDYVVLAAMHVTSKELERWTWQTFWWSPTPDSPKAPSSAEAAAARPADLPGAAGHYATCTAYSMVVPAQPITGGTNLCESASDPGCLLCFNPYLEAGFGNFSPPNEPPKFGVDTNCMSCHGGAHWPSSASEPGYVGDEYVDLGGEPFADVTKLDFLWSLQNAK